MTDRPVITDSASHLPKGDRTMLQTPTAAAEVAGRIWRLVDRELWVVTGAQGSERGGLLATTVSSVSIVPSQPRAVVALAKTHHTTGLVIASGAFALHLLRHDQSMLAATFGLSSGRDLDKFAAWPAELGVTGSPVLIAALRWMECRIESCVDVGDRWLIVGSIQAAGESRSEETPANAHETQRSQSRGSGDSLTPLTLHTWLPQLDAATRDRLKGQLVADGQLDARAIELWRRRAEEGRD